MSRAESCTPVNICVFWQWMVFSEENLNHQRKMKRKIIICLQSTDLCQLKSRLQSSDQEVPCIIFSFNDELGMVLVFRTLVICFGIWGTHSLVSNLFLCNCLLLYAVKVPQLCCAEQKEENTEQENLAILFFYDGGVCCWELHRYLPFPITTSTGWLCPSRFR